MYSLVNRRGAIYLLLTISLSLSLYIYICIYIYIYIYIHVPIYVCIYIYICTPSPPTKIFPIKSPWVKLSGRPPIKFNGNENSHPLELRVCLSQTLRNQNS